MKRVLTLFLILLSLLSLPVFAGNVKQYTLKNGLELLVKPDKRAPVVVSQIWYKVGGSYEHNGITGISHALEHMMFRGTKKYGPGEFVKIISQNGGYENASTAMDYTFYYEQLSADKLALAFKLEADRMRNLVLDTKIFKKEIQVVMEERRMRVDDNPQSLTYERFTAAAYLSSPYHHMTIGWMNDLQNLTDQDLKKWYKAWYAPNNAIVVVVGDVNPDKVYQLAKKFFGPLKPEQLPTIKSRKEVKSLGERQVVIEAPAKLPYILMGYNVPVVKTAKKAWVPYALDVIDGILDAGPSSRLQSKLVRGRQIAAVAGSGYNPFSRLNNLFILFGTPRKNHNISELKKAFLQEINDLKTKPVTSAELARIKAQVIAGHIYEQDSITSQAQEIGSLAVVGLPWQLADEYVKNIEAVTPAQIQMVAKEFLTNKRLTVARLKPLPIENNKPNHYEDITSPGDQHGH